MFGCLRWADGARHEIEKGQQLRENAVSLGKQTAFVQRDPGTWMYEIGECPIEALERKTDPDICRSLLGPSHESPSAPLSPRYVFERVCPDWQPSEYV